MVSRSSKNLLPMIRIAITPAASDAICSTLPKDVPLWPVHLPPKDAANWPMRRQPKRGLFPNDPSGVG